MVEMVTHKGAHVMSNICFDLLKAFSLIESSHTSDVFNRKYPFSYIHMQNEPANISTMTYYTKMDKTFWTSNTLFSMIYIIPPLECVICAYTSESFHICFSVSNLH